VVNVFPIGLSLRHNSFCDWISITLDDNWINSSKEISTVTDIMFHPVVKDIS
jgi:hypothetical protein